MSLNLISKLARDTGCSLSVCNKALTLCDGDYDVSYTYLEMKNSAVARYKNIDGHKVPWTDSDYIAAAKEKCSEIAKDIDINGGDVIERT